MARKVFISFLGASNYQECDYTKDNISYGRFRFIQEATINYLNVKQEWTTTDAIYILLTKESENKNWLDNGQQDGLCTRLANMSLNTPVVAVNELPNGNNEQEIWEIFERLFRLIQKDDELYFDLTHGYRYLPMLMLVLGNYSKFLKQVTIKSITYGNYEVSEKGNKPGLIVDFLPLSQLQDWATAAATLKKHGKHIDLTSSVSNKSNTNQNINHLNQNLLAFEQEITTCRGKKIVEAKSVKLFRDYYKIVKKDVSLPTPVRNILEEVNKQLEPFKVNSYDNLRHAIKWCIDYKMPQQAYTLTQESIITILCDRLKAFNPFTKERKYRDFISSILGVDEKTLNNELEWAGDLARHRELTRSIIQLPWIIELRSNYSTLQSKRNQINHGGFVGDLQVNTIYKDMEPVINSCLQIIDSELSTPIVCTTTSSLFINLSNHPSELWSKEQIEAAQEYGDIVDLPFPDVSPNAGKDEIEALVKEYLCKVMELSQGKTTTVHLMGEMTLTFAMVKRLQAMGIRCIASTSDRLISMESDGTKRVKFDFVRFRDYE